MKFRHAALLPGIVVASAAFAATAGIEFSGILTADGKTRVALTDVATNTTRWLEAGEVFNGYTVARYDAKEDAVFLRKNLEEVRLALETSKTPDTARSNAVASSAPTRSTAPASQPAPNAGIAAAGSPAAANANAALPGAATPNSPNSASPPVAGAPAEKLATAGQPSPAVPSVTTAPAAPAPSEPVASAPPSPGNTPAATDAPSTEPPLTPTGRQPPSPTYVIRGGDTLESIALTQGVSVQQIRELNPILHSTSLRAGETIRIR